MFKFSIEILQIIKIHQRDYLVSGKAGHKYLRETFSEEVESTDVRCLFSEERTRVGINHCLKVLAYIFRLG